MNLERPQRRLQVPGDTVTLTLLFRGEMRIGGPVGADAGAELSPFTSALAGLHTRARTSEHSGSLCGLEVELAPWAAFQTFGVAMHELTEAVARPRELLGERFDDLAADLLAARSWPRRFRLLDTVLGAWASGGPLCSPGVRWAWRELARTAGRIPIRRLVEGTELGWRQLENRFREQIGLSPKSVARVMRLRRTLELLEEGWPSARVASTCGFSDQAHLSREVKRMTGRTPTRFLSEVPGHLTGAGAIGAC